MGYLNNNIYLNLGYCKCENGDIEGGLKELRTANDLEYEEAIELIEKYENK